MENAINFIYESKYLKFSGYCNTVADRNRVLKWITEQENRCMESDRILRELRTSEPGENKPEFHDGEMFGDTMSGYSVNPEIENEEISPF